MNPLTIKLIAALCFTGIVFGTGWQVKGAFLAKEQLGIEKAKDAFMVAYRDAEANKAIILESKLSELKANEKVIERERVKIVNRDVYHNECIDVDGLRLIEQARAGKADTSKPADRVPATH